MTPCYVMIERLTRSSIQRLVTERKKPKGWQGNYLGKQSRSRTRSPEKIVTNILKLQCPICAFSAENRTSLNNHIKMLHTMIKDETCCNKFFPTRWDTFLHLIETHKGCENKFSTLGFPKKLEKQLKLYIIRDPEEENALRLKHPKPKNKIMDIGDVKNDTSVKKSNMNEDEEEEYSSQEEATETDDTNSFHDLNPVVSNVRTVVKDYSDSELEDIENLLSDEDEGDDKADHIEKEEVGKSIISTQLNLQTFKMTEGISTLPNELEGSSKVFPKMNFSKVINTPPELPNLCDIKTEAVSPTRTFTTIIHDDEFVSEFMLEDNDVEGDFKPFYLWANGCVYFCKACNEMSFDDYSAFFKHIKNHKINGLLAYKKKYGEPYSVLNYIQCKICDEKVLQDYNKICSHLRKNHKKYSVSSYYETFVDEKSVPAMEFKESLSVPEIKPEELSISPRIKVEGEAPRLPQLVDYNDSDSSDLPLESKSVDVRVSIDSLLSPEGSIASQTLDSPVDDQCANREESRLTESRNLLTYKEWVDKCAIICKNESCDYTTGDVIDFKLHIISEHGQIFEDYCDTNGLEPSDPWSESKSITCKFCATKVKNNYPDVESHMKSVHKISGFTYYMENIQI
eukprot:TRINITY_DN19569_c0_g1_i1.p1 TRINITY_DN19569_c0_g1~~TRINITY_DN19569_c0_g1_i1.p1  ORF type:complete len:662 (+),score=160.18 TRINITY_DN19569_c0_g1_i1:112-1986(+)